MSKAASRAAIGRQVQLPLRKAFSISLQSIKIRFGRSMITASGIFLGIAFLVTVLMTSLVQQHLPMQSDRAAMEAAKNRQIWLVIMSLLVCTVGITNSMLMSVTERFKEIGTMKCLGALDAFVLELFLLESGVLGVLASFTGWLGGFISIFLLALASHGWAAVGAIKFTQILTTLGIAMAVGTTLTVVATIPPAIRASRMPPAMALRTEI
jgi:predicted lysophospholipase L1 biosynthesis ABC-type transport system permease subunit